MKYTTLIILIILISHTSYSKNLYRIYLKDKGNQTLKYHNELYNSILNNLDEKAIYRRKINLKSDNIISNKDVPIYKKYLDSIIFLNVTIKAELKWYNYIVGEMDSNIVHDIENLSFVSSVQPILEHYNNANNTTTYEDCGQYDYGYSFNHLNLLNIPNLQRYGFTGNGVRIGFLDTGFDWMSHKAIRNSNIRKTYDFVFGDSVVTNQEVDVEGQDHHGTVVFATVSAMDDSNYIGIAPNAEFYLAKTEDLRSETYYELDLFAEAIIWMENNGVDVINASLGYLKLDTLPLNYGNLNGNYTIASRAVNDASKLGMMCVIAVGNNGDLPKTLNAPADADSSIAVGAVGSDGKTLVNFSSNGPNSNGIMKPDLVAQGLNIYSIVPKSEDKYNKTAGTSLSSPQIAGSLGLLKSIYYDYDSYSLKTALYKSADRYSNPDNRFGYGLPNVFNAILDLGVAISPENQLNNGEFKRIVFYIFPEKLIVNPKIKIKFSDYYEKIYSLNKRNFDNQYYVDIPKKYFESSIALGRVIVSSYERDFYYPSSEEYFRINLENELVQCGVNKNEIIPYNKISFDSDFTISPNVIIKDKNFNIYAKFYDNNDIIIRVSDLEGRKIKEENINFGPGILNKEIILNNINSGTYFVSIKYSGILKTKKIIILE